MNRKKFLIYGLFLYTLVLHPHLLAQSIQLTPEEQAFLREHEPIRVSNELDWPPFDFVENGQPSGYSIDYLNLLAEKLDTKWQYINGYSWQELVDKFKSKEIDILHCLSYAKEIAEYGLFTPPYFELQSVVVINEDNHSITNFRDLKDKKIAIISGYKVTEVLMQKFPNAEFIQAENPVDALKMVAWGQAQAYVDTHTVLIYLMKKHFITNLKVVDELPKALYADVSSIRMTVRKDWPTLHRILEKAIHSVSQQEEQMLRQKWFMDVKSKQTKGLYLTTEEIHYLQNRSPIRICVDPDWMPIERINEQQQHEGITADYFQLLSKKINKPFQLVVTDSWGQSVKYMQTRKCDVLSAALPTPEREKYLNFTAPYISFPFVITTKKDRPFISNIESIIDKKLAVIKDYAFSDILRNRYPQIRLEEVENVEVGLRKVYSGEIYGFIDNIVTIGYNIQKNNLVYELKIVGHFEENWQLSIGVRNDDPMLFAILNKAAASIKEKERRAIFNKWLTIKYEQNVDYQLLIRVLVIGGIIILVFGYWNRKLAKEIHLRQQAEQAAQLRAEEITVKNTKLVQLNQEKNEFLSIAAHDLKNPLHSIQGAAELITLFLQDDPIDKQQILEYADMIEVSAGRMFDLITNLLDVNAIEAGKINIHFEYYNILLVSRRIIIDYQDKAKYKKIDLFLEAAAEDYIAYVDKNIIYQILDNLISNAIKYSPIGGKVILEVSNLSQWVQCKVIDEGEGLSLEEQKQLFGKFKRLSTKPTGGEHSTGLGLFIVKKLVEVLRGNIYCESKIGQGSIFILQLPKSKDGTQRTEKEI